MSKSILYSDSNKFRPEELDLKLKLSFFNLGTTDQSTERIRDLVIVGGSSSSTEKRSTTKVVPYFIDSQVFGDGSGIVTRQSTSLQKPGGDTTPGSGDLSRRSPIKRLLPLIPPTLPGSLEVVRQLRNAFDNTMFAYITQFDKVPSSYVHLTLAMLAVRPVVIRSSSSAYSCSVCLMCK